VTACLDGRGGFCGVLESVLADYVTHCGAT